LLLSVNLSIIGKYLLACQVKESTLKVQQELLRHADIQTTTNDDEYLHPGCFGCKEGREHQGREYGAATCNKQDRRETGCLKLGAYWELAVLTVFCKPMKRLAAGGI